MSGGSVDVTGAVGAHAGEEEGGHSEAAYDWRPTLARVVQMVEPVRSRARTSMSVAEVCFVKPAGANGTTVDGGERVGRGAARVPTVRPSPCPQGGA